LFVFSFTQNQMCEIKEGKKSKSIGVCCFLYKNLFDYDIVRRRRCGDGSIYIVTTGWTTGPVGGTDGVLPSSVVGEPHNFLFYFLFSFSK
jgi:hypothetical protein